MSKTDVNVSAGIARIRLQTPMQRGILTPLDSPANYRQDYCEWIPFIPRETGDVEKIKLEAYHVNNK